MVRIFYDDSLGILFILFYGYTKIYIEMSI